MDNIYYVVTKKRVKRKAVGGFEIEYFKITVGIDLYYGCEKFSQIRKEKQIGHIEASVNECEGITLDRKLEEFVIDSVRAYSKILMGVEHNPVPITK